jgi:hypothetical protein
MCRESRIGGTEVAHGIRDWITESNMNHPINRKADIDEGVRLLTPTLERAACGCIPGDRRREVRHSARVSCRVVRRADWHVLGIRTVDLSPEGMLVVSNERADKGSELLVSFQATELPIWFDTRAVVTRIVEGRRRGDEGRALGVRFESLAAVPRLIMRGHLRKLPRPLPLRDPPQEFGPEEECVDYANLLRRALRLTATLA